MLQQHPGLYFAPSDKHRLGMFCTEDIQKDSIIEICPVLIIPVEEATMIKKGHMLYAYYFEWFEEQIAIALGYGSLYNHDSKPNAVFTPDYLNEHVVFEAAKEILAGTEILVDYHAGIPGKDLWFDIQ